MPYEQFYIAAEERGYDLEALARQFDASFEQVAHRLTTLHRAGQVGIPFFFVRIDTAGNVSKRLDGAGFPFSRHGGGCPLWNVHYVFRNPGEIVTQWLELLDGQRFYSIARSTSANSGPGQLRLRRAIALCCTAEDAKRPSYAGTGQPVTPAGWTPIGVGCRVCYREPCTARAVPPMGRALLPDDYHRKAAPFGFGDD